eukprot:PhM_4_TR3522/c0_g1_i1/m.105212
MGNENSKRGASPSATAAAGLAKSSGSLSRAGSASMPRSSAGTSKATYEALLRAEEGKMVIIDNTARSSSKQRFADAGDDATEAELEEAIHNDALLNALSAVPDAQPLLAGDLDGRWVARADRRRHDIQRQTLPTVRQTAPIDFLATVQTSMLRRFDAARKEQDAVSAKMRTIETDIATTRVAVSTATASLRSFYSASEECQVVSRGVDDVHSLCSEVHDLLLAIERDDALLKERREEK